MSELAGWFIGLEPYQKVLLIIFIGWSIASIGAKAK